MTAEQVGPGRQKIRSERGPDLRRSGTGGSQCKVLRLEALQRTETEFCWSGVLGELGIQARGDASGSLLCFVPVELNSRCVAQVSQEPSVLMLQLQ